MVKTLNLAQANLKSRRFSLSFNMKISVCDHVFDGCESSTKGNQFYQLQVYWSGQISVSIKALHSYRYSHVIDESKPTESLSTLTSIALFVYVEIAYAHVKAYKWWRQTNTPCKSSLYTILKFKKIALTILSDQSINHTTINKEKAKHPIVRCCCAPLRCATDVR